MDISFLKDFVVFSRYLNFTRAANELNIAQSNLSKHIQQLEHEMGCLLVDRDNNNALTPMGHFVLGKASEILNIYDSLKTECKIISKSYMELIFQDPPVIDEASERFFNLIDHFRAEVPICTYRFERIKRESIVDALLEGDIHVGFLYDYGDIKEIEKEWQT